MIELVCFNCSNKMSFSAKPGSREECDKCHSDVHCCRNCEFYDSKVYNECRETNAEVIREKERSNYCDYFTSRAGGAGGQDQKAKLKLAAEALFKKS